ncbi:MAG TPA: hypothetical protein VGY52_14685 [Roseiarcus sp.]|jgi:hypothetical protein|nr:hypothetical protein [Roseiarcus sp.]
MASGQGRESQDEARRRRLASALRENLKRRKAQERGRAREADAPRAPEASPNRGDSRKI